MKKFILTSLIIFYLFSNIFSQSLLDAVKSNNIAKVNELITAGKNVNEKDENNASTLMWAAHSADLELVKLLVEKGADFTQKGAIFTEDGQSYYGNLLGIAAGLNKIEILKFLIEDCKISVDDKEFVLETSSETGWTALQWASVAGNDEIVKYLLEKGANINQNHTADAGTPLLYALQYGKTSTAEILIDNGADVNLGNSAGWYPIHFATNTRMYKVLEKMIKAGADVNTKTPEGYNSLVLCAYNYFYSSCKLLLENGANTTFKDKNGYSALDYAKMYNYNLIYQMMLNPKFEPEINQQNLAELINISVDYYWSEKYSETTELLEKILPLVKTSYGENDTTYYGILLSYLAYSYDILENYSTAENNYLKTIELYEKLNTKSQMLYYTSNYLAEMYLKTLDFSKAEIFYLKTLDLIKNIYGENSYDYVNYINSVTDFYIEKNDLAKVEEYYLKTLIVYKNFYGETNPVYTNLLLTLAEFYHKKLDTKNAEIYYLEYLENIKLIYGEKNIYYTTALYLIAEFYWDFGFYLKAEEYMLQDLTISEEVTGKNNEEYLSSLENLAELYSETGNYQLAKEKYSDLLEFKKNLYTENSSNYAKIQSSLAGVYSDLGDFTNAEKLYLEALTILENLNLQNSSDYIAATNGLAIIYQTNGNYPQAEQLFLKTIEIGKNSSEIRPIDYTICISNLAELYRVSGNFEKAEPLYLESLEKIKNIISENCEEYANTLNNLGLLYYNKADYQKAETNFLQAKEIRKNVLGEYHPDYAVTLNNLGLMYQTVGNYYKADELFSKALYIRENTIGINHPAYAVSLCNLGLNYIFFEDFENAIIVFKEAIRIQEENVSLNNPNLATYYDNLATCYNYTKNYTEAEKYILKALEIRKELLGTEHINYAVSLTKLANIYLMNKKNTEAEKILIEAVEIIKNQIGTKNLTFSETIANLAFFYIFTEQFEKADNIVFEANEIFNYLSVQSTTYMSEYERRIMLLIAISYYSDIFNKYAFKRSQENHEFNKMFYNNALIQKNAILNSSIAMRKEILFSDNEELKKIYSAYIENNQFLALLYSQQNEINENEINEFNTDSLEEITNTLEKQLYSNLSEFENLSMFENVKWPDIQNSLNDNEAAIELCDFGYIFSDTIFYYASILTNKMNYPEIVYLCNEKQLDTLLYKDEFADEFKYIKKLYTYEQFGDSIFKFVWKPFDSLLTEINTVYISPSGLLNNIAFDAIPNSDSTLISDKYLIKYVSTTANILNKKVLFSSEVEDISLFGDINYDVDTLVMKEVAQNHKSEIEDEISIARSLDYLGESVSRGGVWQYLSGTKEEIYGIKNIFEKYNYIPNLYTQNNASEELFKSFSNNSPSLIHIATHGFYFPYEEKNKETYEFLGQEIQYIFSENPLLRSGIILSGGNNVWSNIEIPENVEDGVLSAYEISNMNMFGTKLVVLSACQTGLGDDFGSEGVFGLRRALKMAGVDFIIMSLWSVPDEQTKELMTEFYRNFVAGKEVRIAFKEAQNYMKIKYQEVAGAAYAWAAFVLIE